MIEGGAAAALSCAQLRPLLQPGLTASFQQLQRSLHNYAAAHCEHKSAWTPNMKPSVSE